MTLGLARIKTHEIYSFNLIFGVNFYFYVKTIRNLRSENLLQNL
jgi:hypothetical protein